MITIEGQIVDDREIAARPPKTISTESCLYDAPSYTLFGYLYEVETGIGVTYPEWVAIESHITGARYILGINMTQKIDACETHNGVSYARHRGEHGVSYVFKHGDTHPTFKQFMLFKTRERMIKLFREVIKE